MTFVHLHNHTDYSMLDGATRISAMVERAIELGMPAIAITDHGYMYGVPELDLETMKRNHAQADWKQWASDCEAARGGSEMIEPEVDDELAHAQWERDVSAYREGKDLRLVRPRPLIKPIFGCEIYLTDDEELSRNRKPTLYHLILLAKNKTGYVNLMKLVSDAATRGFYYKPRVTLSMLKERAEGLICLSGCVAGVISRSLITGQFDTAMEWATKLRDIFEPGDFYIELQEHGNTFENGWTDRKISEHLITIAQAINVKVVATNDFHYLTREDAQTQDLMMCIGMNAKFDDQNRMRMSGSEYYLKSSDEMRALFDWCPEACDTTLEIAEKCDVELDWGNVILPRYPLDAGETNESQFRRDCEQGLARRYGPNWRVERPDVLERFEYEYEVICAKGFAAYFLIVADYVRWAKEQGIGVGPGRGSAAGAIVTYALDITTFDPLENGLMFERFLSPERAEMPDIDMDFDDERRLEVIEYVRQRYGSERVTHIITYSTIKAKQAINDAARVLDFPVFRAQHLSKMISNDPNAKLKFALEKTSGKEEQFSADFAEAYAANIEDKRIIDAALEIEGLTRGEGMHACAVLICRDPVNEHVPTKLDTKGGVEITQYEGHIVAEMGLLKMDFLGLRTLTVISKAKENIKANHGVDVDVDAIPFDDKKIFELLSSGRTAGVFQVESGGMTATIKQMRPTEYKHVVALIALYRPGPLGAGMVTDYIDRMNGKKQVVYYDERLASILEETYGTIVYQEQVMQISMKMSGFSAGESDKVRKAVAKKKITLMQKVVQHWDDGTNETMEDHWMNGAERNGFSREIAKAIWDDVLQFASYAFNKSHSAGYAILVMQTAWLKAHYPHEYMAAVLTSYTGKTDKIVHYIGACHHEGIDILPPDINESGTEFTAVSGGIRFGLAGIRGVGEGAAESILAERERGGPFKNLYDFIERFDFSRANRRVIEALIRGGAFDSTGYPRRQLMELVSKENPENLVDAAIKRHKNKVMGQTSLFDMFADTEGSGFEANFPDPSPEEWERGFKLAQEKYVLGIYVSDHPLRPYEYALSRARTVSITEALTGQRKDGIALSPSDDSVWLAGMVSNLQKKTTKKGDTMAVAQLEDTEGEITMVIFPKVYARAAETLGANAEYTQKWFTSDVFVRVQGRIDRTDRGEQFLVQNVEALELGDEMQLAKTLVVLLPSPKLSRFVMESLQTLFERHSGFDRVELRVESGSGATMRIEIPVRVDAENTTLLAELKDLLGEGASMRVA